jgi:hypothetical protein
MGHEVEISYDDDGSCLVYTTTDVPGGSPLRMSYGDYYLTNPSATLGEIVSVQLVVIPELPISY